MKRRNFIFVFILFFGFNNLIFSQIEKKVIIKKDKSESKSWLGVLLKQMNDEKVIIEKVFEDSPAEKSGLVSGDVINFINEKEIKNASDVVEAIKNFAPNTKIKIIVLRDNAKKELSVTLGIAPSNEIVKEFEWNDSDGSESDINLVMPHEFLMKKIGFNNHHKGMLGLEVETLNKQLAEYFNSPDKKGVLVKFVDSSGLGAKSGFKAGDVIIKIGNDRIKNVNDITELIEDAKKGDTFVFEILRNNSSKKLNIVFNENASENCSAKCSKNDDFNMPNFKFHLNPNSEDGEMEKFLHKMQKPKIKMKEIKLEIIEL